MRTLKLGHHLTQGTADSNELWLELTAKSGGQIIGGSGAVDRNGQVDPWAYFFNVFMLDRHGRRIDRRNVQDIFVPLYDHQVPPGAAAVVHYELKIPSGLTAPVEVEARLQYRKFDRGFTRFALGETARTDIPVTTIATDRVEFPIARSRLFDRGDVADSALGAMERLRHRPAARRLGRQRERRASAGRRPPSPRSSASAGRMDR